MPEGEGWFETAKRWFRENALDWLWGRLQNATWFKSVVAFVIAVTTGIFAYFSGHPALLHGALGAIAASAFILLPTIVRALWPRRSDNAFRSASDRAPAKRFKQFSRGVAVVGPMSADLRDLEHHWDQCQRAYCDMIDCWNRMWRDASAIHARKWLSEGEKLKLSSERVDAGLTQVFSATSEFATRTQQLSAFVDAHFSEWKNENSN